jgi:hypothetical protein
MDETTVVRGNIYGFLKESALRLKGGEELIYRNGSPKKDLRKITFEEIKQK